MSVSLWNWIHRGVKCLCRFETGYRGVSNVCDALKLDTQGCKMSVSLWNWTHRGVKCLCRFETGYTGVSNVCVSLKLDTQGCHMSVSLWNDRLLYGELWRKIHRHYKPSDSARPWNKFSQPLRLSRTPWWTLEHYRTARCEMQPETPLTLLGKSDLTEFCSWKEKVNFVWFSVI